MNISSGIPYVGTDLVGQYIAEETSLGEKTRIFDDVLVLMKKNLTKSSSAGSGISKDMYAIIKATPPEILSLKLSGAELFSYPMTLFQDYVDLSLKEMGFHIEIESEWGKINEETRKNICSSMVTAFDAVGDVLTLRQRILGFRLPPEDIFSKDHEEIIICEKRFEQKINRSQILIDEGSSSVVNLRKRIRRIANISQETAEKIKQESQAFKTFVESTLPRKDAKRFQTTADNHRSRARRSISMALGLGIIGVGWGVFLSIQDLQTSCGGYWFCISFDIGVRGFLLAAGILVIGIYASVRSYFAHSQSEANNQQRFNALESYENMIKLVSNLSIPDDAKKLITEKAIECIYSHQPTGFVKEQKDSDAKTTLVLPQISIPSTSEPPR